MRPVGHKPAHSRSPSKVRARPATRQEGLSYASAASSSGLNLDDSMHSPNNRTNTSRFPRPNNRSRSRPRFIPSSDDSRDNSAAQHTAPVELREFSKQLEKLGSLIERLTDSTYRITAKLDDVHSRLTTIEEIVDSDHRRSDNLCKDDQSH